MNESSCCSPFGVISVLCFGSSNGSIVISYCCFSLHFPDDIWCGASYLPSVSSLVWYLLKSLAHFLIGLLLIFKLQEFFSSLQILDMSFFGCMCWRYFLLICVLYFHFLSGSFVSSESFDFNKFQFISFYGWGYGLATKFWPALKSRKIPTFSSRSFTSLDFTLGNWPTLSLFLCTVWVVSKILFFPLFQYPGVPALPNDSSVLSSSNYLDTFVKDQWIL